MVYQWKWGAPIPAQAAGERFEALEQEHGEITPRIVLDDARDEKALLHPCFEWNDRIAAELYREKQAGDLIRSLEVKIERKDKPPQSFRAFISVVNDTEKRVYINQDKALSVPSTRRQALMDAKRDCDAFRRKYELMAELRGVIDAIDEFESDIEVNNV